MVKRLVEGTVLKEVDKKKGLCDLDHFHDKGVAVGVQIEMPEVRTIVMITDMANV